MTTNKTDKFEVFPWNANFEIGVPLIDEQHQKLVELINTLASHLVYNDMVELNRILNELAAYADYHFKTEESVWEPCFKDDDWFIEHQKNHDSFIPKVLKLKEGKKTKLLEVVIEDIITFLVNWLAYHILENDKRMAIVLHAVESGQTLAQAKEVARQKMSESTKVLTGSVTMYNTISSRTLDFMKEREACKQIAETLLERTTELENANRNLVSTQALAQQSEERLALALDGGNLGFWDVNLTADEMIVNQRWKEMTGYPPDAPDKLTGGEWLNSVHPDDKDRIFKFTDAYRKGEIDTYEIEYRVITRSGDVQWQFSKGKTVIKEKELGIVRMVGTVMDITDRKEAEEKLKQTMADLARFNNLATGREMQIINLKKEVNALLIEHGRDAKFKSVE